MKNGAEFQIKVYTKAEMSDVLKNGIDDLNDLILMSYLEVIKNKKYTGMVPDVIEVYSHFSVKFSSGAWETILKCGDACSYITVNDIADFLLKNELYSKWGMVYIKNPVIPFKFKDDMFMELFG